MRLSVTDVLTSEEQALRRRRKLLRALAVAVWAAAAAALLTSAWFAAEASLGKRVGVIVQEPFLKVADLNPYVLQTIEEYNRDAAVGVALTPSDPAYVGHGVTKDLYYRGKKIASGDPQRRHHCIGLLFEVWLSAWDRATTATGATLTVGDGSHATFERFRRRFYGADGNMGTCVDALAEYQLGREITKWEEAKAGDFLQYWRPNGRGHTGVFLGWVRDDQTSQIVGFKLWHSAMKGIVTEDFLFRSGIPVEYVYLVRPLLVIR